MPRMSLVLAAAVVLAAAIALNRFMSVVGVPGLGQLSVSALFLGIKRVDHYISGVLERKGSISTEIEGYKGFGLPWYTMLVYGTFVFAAALQAAGFVAGATIGLAGGHFEDLRAVLVVDVIVGGSAALFFIGHWLGSRCIAFGIPVLFAVVLLGRVVVAVIDYTALSASQYEDFAGVKKNAAAFAISAFAGSLFFAILAAIFGLFGFWRGRQTRLVNYLQLLLGQVSNETRQTIVNLAYEEAQRAEAGHVPTPPTTARPAPA